MRFTRLKIGTAACAALSICCVFTGAYAQESATGSTDSASEKDAILILDASGSMWGQINGVNKIVIAKDVVEGLVRGLPASQRLGFVAYGHRRKGDCNDIQTLAAVGADREKVIEKLRELSPTGKTPLSKSVEHAATELNYTRNAATVILVSDGLETCAADPCALAKTLEEQGLDFTVHVIGFDVTPQERAGLQCIATETGGEFLAAANADELTEALAQVTGIAGTSEPADAAGKPVPSTLALKASMLSGGPQIQSDLAWKVMPAAGGEAIFTTTSGGSAVTEILPGQYVAEVVWTGWRKGHPDGGSPKTGRMEFSINPQQPKVITVPVDLGIPVMLKAPAQTAEGIPFEVTWSGPDSLGAYVHVNRLDDGPREVIYGFSAQRTRDAYAKTTENLASLDTDGDGDFDQDDLATGVVGGPSVAGDYEVRYVLDAPRLILARRPLTVTDSIYTLAVPSEAPVATEIGINWQGPLTDGDFVTLIAAGSEKVFENGLTARLTANTPATLTTPATAGDYEVRYILANGYTLYPDMQRVVQAAVPIKIVDVTATITGPPTAIGGSTIDVMWTGPADQKLDDFVSVVERGAEKYNRMSYSKLYARDGSALASVPIRVPAIDGDYELVYVLEPGQRIIARTPLTITRAQASLTAPATVKAGEAFDVTYTGDGFKGDRVIFLPADVPDNKMWQWGLNYGFSAASDTTSGSITARLTKEPGKFEVRYVTGLQHQVLARAKITVTE